MATTTWEQSTILLIKKLHEQATNNAYELGREIARSGRTVSPIDLCDALDVAFEEGVRDEKAGKP